MIVEKTKLALRGFVKLFWRFPFRGKARLFQTLTPYLIPDGGFENVRIGNYTIRLDHSIRAMRLMAYGIYEHEELRYLAKHIPRGATVFDLGANVGYFAAKLAEIVGKTGRVYSFEPSPTCLKALYELTASSRNETIRIVPHAVAEASRMSTYFETEKVLTHGFGRIDLRPTNHHTVTSEESVQVTSVDDFCDSHRIEEIALVKIDVEGAELQVLQGMQRFFQRGKRPSLMIEITGGPDHRVENLKINDLLRSLNYECVSMTQPSGMSIDLEKLPQNFHGNLLWRERANTTNHPKP